MRTIAMYLRLESARSGCVAIRTLTDGCAMQSSEWQPIDPSLLTEKERDLLCQGRVVYIHSDHVNYTTIYQTLKPPKSRQKGTHRDTQEAYLKKKWRKRRSEEGDCPG